MDQGADKLWAFIAQADRIAFAIKGGILDLSYYPGEVRTALEAYLKSRGFYGRS
jgi:hypothetical protein